MSIASSARGHGRGPPSRHGFRGGAIISQFRNGADAWPHLGPVAEGLRQHGVLVRYFRTWPDALRISIGKPSEMAALFKALSPLTADLQPQRPGAMGAGGA